MHTRFANHKVGKKRRFSHFPTIRPYENNLKSIFTGKRVFKFSRLAVDVVSERDRGSLEICRGKELRSVTVETQEGRRDTEDRKG